MLSAVLQNESENTIWSTQIKLTSSLQSIFFLTWDLLNYKMKNTPSSFFFLLTLSPEIKKQRRSSIHTFENGKLILNYPEILWFSLTRKAPCAQTSCVLASLSGKNMFKGINKNNMILTYDDAHFFHFFSQIVVYSEDLLKISPIWALMKAWGEKETHL